MHFYHRACAELSAKPEGLRILSWACGVGLAASFTQQSRPVVSLKRGCSGLHGAQCDGDVAGTVLSFSRCESGVTAK